MYGYCYGAAATGLIDLCLQPLNEGFRIELLDMLQGTFVGRMAGLVFITMVQVGAGDDEYLFAF